MVLPNLAAPADLSTRGIDTSNTVLTDTMLAVASATVRRACASPVLEHDSTVTLIGWGGQWIDLPGKPVTAVTSVTLDGQPVSASDYTFDGGRLWRYCGWGYECAPLPVVVELTHGYASVPADVKDLVCSLAGAGIAAAAEGYATHNGVVAEKIDDYSVTYAQGAEAVASVMDLPAGTKRWLKAAFGGGAGLVESR